MCIVIQTTRREVHNSRPMFTYYIVQCVSVPRVWRDDGKRNADESLYSAYARKIAIWLCDGIRKSTYVYRSLNESQHTLCVYANELWEVRLHVRRRLNPRPYQRRAVLHMRSTVSCALYINETRFGSVSICTDMPHIPQQPTKSQ